MLMTFIYADISGYCYKRNKTDDAVEICYNLGIHNACWVTL